MPEHAHDCELNLSVVAARDFVLIAAKLHITHIHQLVGVLVGYLEHILVLSLVGVRCRPIVVVRLSSRALVLLLRCVVGPLSSV